MAKNARDENRPKRRSIWTGSIHFGLVSVPVKMYPAVAERRVHFHQLHDSDGARIREEHVCTMDGARVSYQHIAKGYELGDGKLVIVTPKELAAVEGDRERAIEIEAFVDPREIDPLHYGRGYWLAPDEGAGKAYALLAAAMQRAGKAGVARATIRGREHLALVRPASGALSLMTLQWADELVPAAAIPGLPRSADRPNDHELGLATRLVAWRSTRFQPDRWHDEQRERLLAYLARKAEGAEALPEPTPSRVEEGLGLVDALQASLAGAPANEPPARPRRKAGKSHGRAA